MARHCHASPVPSAVSCIAAASLPIALFVLSVTHTFSVQQIAGLWLCDVFGFSFLFVTIPAYIGALLLYRNASDLRFLLPGYGKMMTALLAVDTIIALIDLIMIVSFIISFFAH